MLEPDESDETYMLDPTETYLFTNCSRHADTLGLILGLPLAGAGKVLAQRRLPAANPYMVGITVGGPILLATYISVSSLYFSSVCWGYTRFLPENSYFRERLKEAEMRYNSWCTAYNRTRAVQDVMFFDKQARMDTNMDLSEAEFVSRQEMHEIQKQLRWVPSEKFRIAHRVREAIDADHSWDNYRERCKFTERNFFSPPPIMKDVRLKNAAKPMPKEGT